MTKNIIIREVYSYDDDWDIDYDSVYTTVKSEDSNYLVFSNGFFLLPLNLKIKTKKRIFLTYDKFGVKRVPMETIDCDIDYAEASAVLVKDKNKTTTEISRKEEKTKDGEIVLVITSIREVEYATIEEYQLGHSNWKNDVILEINKKNIGKNLENFILKELYA